LYQAFYYGFSAAVTATPEVVFAASLDGNILAYDIKEAATLWKYNTARDTPTVNAVPGHGGSIDNAGVQVAGDMLFVQSGYSMFRQMPGNVLMAFKLRAD
jgi:polyvinyl alcohol dehydrogenase (cytochrome)